LYDRRGVFKVADFGLSALIPRDYDSVVSTIKAPGNVGHMAPEIIAHRNFGTKADVFSFGTLLWEIVRGHEWEEEVLDHLAEAGISAHGNVRQIVKQAVLQRNFRPRVPHDWPDALRRVLEACWQLDPDARPTMAELIDEHLPSVADAFRRAEIVRWLGHDPVAHDFWLSNFAEYVPDGVPWSVFVRTFYDYMQMAWLGDGERDADIPRLFFQLALNAMPTHASRSNASSSSGSSSSSSSSSSQASSQASSSRSAAAGAGSSRPPAMAAAVAAASTSASAVVGSPSGRQPAALADGEIVTLERFGQVAAAFGPLQVGKGLDFLRRIASVLNNRWFHPSIITQAQTTDYLLGQQDGTFVVRFSSKPGAAFTIARAKRGRLVQTRVSRRGTEYVIEDRAFAHLTFPSMLDIIQQGSKHAKDLGLTSYIRFSLTPGEKLLMQPLEDDDAYGVDVGDLVLEVLNATGRSPSNSNESFGDYSASSSWNDSSFSASPFMDSSMSSSLSSPTQVAHPPLPSHAPPDPPK
jgi:Protein tyrosine and serine/threonine kinase/SH2 domain